LRVIFVVLRVGLGDARARLSIASSSRRYGLRCGEIRGLVSKEDRTIEQVRALVGKTGTGWRKFCGKEIEVVQNKILWGSNWAWPVRVSNNDI